MKDSDNQEMESCGSKLRRREIMPYSRFTKIIINHFLSLHKSIPKGLISGLNTIKDDGVIQRLKFVNKVTIKPTGVDESDREPANRPTRRRRPSGITFRDTLNVSKKKSLDQSQKLKGIQVMTEEEQLAADTKKAIKASKEAVRLQQQIEDSSEGAGIMPEILDELTGKFTTSSEGAGIVPEGLEDVSHQSDDEYVNRGEITWLSTNEEEKGNEDDDEEDDDKSIDIAKTDDERTDSENDDQAMTDADKIVAKKSEEEKGDEEKEQADDDQA
ncbi:hypothetical protein Tco_1268842 [Tanacetum coccineum]